MSYLTKYILQYRINEENTLLVNTLSGAFDMVDNKTKEKIDMLSNSIQDINDDNLINILKVRGYLYNSIEDEGNAINRYMELNKKLSLYKKKHIFVICPTMGCNLRCTYCFEPAELHKKFDIMSYEQIDSIFQYINKIKELDNIKPQVQLFGGEPLLKCNYNIVKKIFENCQKMKVPVKIITNGTTIYFYKELLMKYADILNIQVTLDGEQYIHDKRRIRRDGSGTFEDICNSIDKLIELDIMTFIRINIDKDNINSIEKLDDIIRKHNWDKSKKIFLYFAPVVDFCGASDKIFTESELLRNIKEKYPDIGKKNCLIKRIVSPVIGYLDEFLNFDNSKKPWKMDYCEATSGGTLIFTPDGNICTCLSFAGKNKYIIGKFDNEKVIIDESMARLWFERSIFRIPKCKNCKFALLCGGGCPVAALEQNNDIDCPVCSDIERTLQVYINNIKDQLMQRFGG